MIRNSPDSYINVFHIHFHFQENISAETVFLRTFQAFRRANTGVRSFFFAEIQADTCSSFNKNSVPCLDLHKTDPIMILLLQYTVFDLQ